MNLANRPTDIKEDSDVTKVSKRKGYWRDMIRLELCQCGVACVRSYNSLLLFLTYTQRTVRVVQTSVCPIRLFFLQRELGRAAMGIAVQCQLRTMSCSLGKVLLWCSVAVWHQISSRQCVPTFSNNDAAESECESSLVKHRSEKHPAFQFASPWFDN